MVALLVLSLGGFPPFFQECLTEQLSAGCWQGQSLPYPEVVLAPELEWELARVEAWVLGGQEELEEEEEVELVILLAEEVAVVLASELESQLVEEDLGERLLSAVFADRQCFLRNFFC